jgi:hypothetical protein
MKMFYFRGSVTRVLTLDWQAEVLYMAGTAVLLRPDGLWDASSIVSSDFFPTNKVTQIYKGAEVKKACNFTSFGMSDPHLFSLCC